LFIKVILGKRYLEAKGCYEANAWLDELVYLNWMIIIIEPYVWDTDDATYW
jgi:hypothetical protein